jgi:predicted GNAT superfamily acetyltransferase
MLGFLFGFPTSEPHKQYSQRLAVHPDSRGMGLGARLKWYQRDWCQSRGISMVCWTYDPLLSINATLNIEQLGATAGTYHEDYYGEMQGINAGAPSDRLLAEWHLASELVTKLANDGRPVTGRCIDKQDCLFVAIPANFSKMLSEDQELALSERLRVRAELQCAFAQGYRITGFDKRTHRYSLTVPRT